MAERYYNPFAAIDVSIPTEYHADVVRYCQQEARASLDQSPFPRMVDLWFLAVSVAARLALKPEEVAGRKTTKIIDGSIFNSDPWRVHTLMLVAIAQAGTVDIVSDSRRMMAIANGLAIAGLPKALDLIKEGGGDPIWNLSEAVQNLVASN